MPTTLKDLNRRVFQKKITEMSNRLGLGVNLRDRIWRKSVLISPFGVLVFGRSRLKKIRSALKDFQPFGVNRELLDPENPALDESGTT